MARASTIALLSLMGRLARPTPGTVNFQFESGKAHRLRLINAGAEGFQKFSIDDHVLTVITIDFVPIVPYTSTIVTMVGALVSIIVVFLTDYPNRKLVSEPTFSLQPTSTAYLLSGCA
jgi:FtsP/CotA-like multicopper oxidase with cupredoxin domain